MTTIIDHDMVESIVRNYAESNMRATVRIARTASPTLSATDELIAIPTLMRLIYEGKGRVYTVSGPQPSFGTDEDQVFSTSFISVPLKDSKGLTVVSQVNDLIEIVEHSDNLLVGRVFRVLDVDAGGQWPAVRRHMVSSAQRFAGWTWIDEPEVTP
jgi:uncharacterized protein DUF6093